MTTSLDPCSGERSTSAFEFTDQMNEISGFGGSYERGCRAMVIAGAVWCADHPEAEPQFRGWSGVYGLIEEVNDAARGLRRAIEQAPFTTDDGRKVRMGDEMTGAMYHAAVNHIMFIAQNGWNAYRDKMSAPLHIVEDAQPQVSE